MARGVYTIKGDNLTVISGPPVTLAYINPGSGAGFTSIEILRCWVSQRANATSNQQGIGLFTSPTTFPTLVTVTPAPVALIDGASKIVGGTAGAAGTCGINASAEGTGTKTYIYEDNFNVLNGWLWVPTPVDTIVVSAGSASGFGMAFTSTPATLTNWSWGITYREW